MAERVVKPAGAGHETALVLLSALFILVGAGTAVGLRATHEAVYGVAEHQLDARDDLSAAEQGLYADLRLVDAELAAWPSPQPPEIAELADDMLPPFVRDIGATQRGGHVWALLERAGDYAYLGVSAQPSVAGSLLLIVRPAAAIRETPFANAASPVGGARDDSGAGEAPDIWLYRADGVVPPERLEPAWLIAAGWRQVVTRFDAGVTRHAH